MRNGAAGCRQRGKKMGRGSSKLGGGLGGGGLGGGLAGGGLNAGAGAPPPNVQPGQPVPAITVQQLQSMNDQQFADYLNGLKSTPIDGNIYYNDNWDTQRLIANMPELNKAPQIVDPQAFASLPGDTIYRTVNQTGKSSAFDVCNRTMTSDVTTIGEGVMGDGFYFHIDKNSSQTGYGRYKNDINKTATMQAKLNQNAKVVRATDLESMLSGESRTVQRAVRNMSSGGSWTGDSGLMAYALKKGYNVVERGGRVYNVIDRSAATWSGEVVPWT